jgi:Tfp pilus assembly protein PilX
MQKGFTLFIAIVTTATLLLISAGVVNLALKQNLISNISKESQYAFYAADTGMECAIYWDVNNPSGVSAFAIDTVTSISCLGIDASVGGAETSEFNLEFSPEPFCATVRVTKRDDGSTTIESSGYNTCDPSNPRRVERAIRAVY